jgi:hypothetical protein
MTSARRRWFAPHTEIDGDRKKEWRLEEGDRGGHNHKTDRNATKEEICNRTVVSLRRYSASPRAAGSRDQIPVRTSFSRTRPDRPWDPPSLLHNGYRLFFPGVKRAGCGVNHPLPPWAEVQERVEPYLYSASGNSWPVLGWPLPFTVAELLLRKP